MSTFARCEPSCQGCVPSIPWSRLKRPLAVCAAKGGSGEWDGRPDLGIMAVTSAEPELWLEADLGRPPRDDRFAPHTSHYDSAVPPPKAAITKFTGHKQLCSQSRGHHQ